MSIEERIIECAEDIKKLKPGEAFVMSFDVELYDNQKSDASLTSMTSKKINGQKIKSGRKSRRCYHDKYSGKKRNEVRDALCTNANLIVQGSVLSMKIVKILENLKKKRNLLYSLQEYTDKSVFTDGYSIKDLSSSYRNNFVNYKDILPSENKINSSLYDDNKKIKSKCYSKKDTENDLTSTTEVTGTTTTDSFYTSNEKSSKNQSNITNEASTKTTVTTTLESTDPKKASTSSNTAITTASIIGNKYGIKPISPRLNRKIAKLIENEEKKRKNNEMIKQNEKESKIGTSKTVISSNAQSQLTISSLDSTQKEKGDTIYSNVPTSTASTAISIKDKTSVNGTIMSTILNKKGNSADQNLQQNSSSLFSVQTAEPPVKIKKDEKCISVPNTPSVGTVTAISIKDFHLNNIHKVVEKKVENPEISSNALQSNLSSVQTAQLPPHIQPQNFKTSAP